MGISRRGFLGAILATAIAPAIVKAANLMKVVPISDTGIVGPDWTLDNLDYSPSLCRGMCDQDFTVEMWSKAPDTWHAPAGLKRGKLQDGAWHHVAQTKQGGTTKFYIDGEQVPSGEIAALDGFITKTQGGPFSMGADVRPPFDGYIDGVKVSNRPLYSSEFVPPTDPMPTMKFGSNSMHLTGPSVRLTAPGVIPTVPAILTDSADVTLSKFQKAFFGRALADVSRINNKVGQLIDQWEQPLITTPFDKLENKS